MQPRAAFFVAVIMVFRLQIHAAETPTLKLENKVELPGVEGRIDHMDFDIKGDRLFVAALGNNSVEIIDLKQGKRIKSLPDLKEAQGLAWAPDSNKLFVACGGDGSVHVFDGDSFEQKNVIHLGDDADNMRYSSATKHLYVGYGNGAIAIFDPANGKVVGEIKVSGHPEAFQLDSAGKKIFANVPSKHIEVLDIEQKKRIVEWKLSEASGNFPMALALAENSKRLFIGCRSPAKILVIDSESGKTVATLDGPGDVDDIFFAATAKRLYSSGGDGYVYIHVETDADHYSLAAKIPTAPGARTSLLTPEESKLIVAVPHRGQQQTEIRVYNTK